MEKKIQIKNKKAYYEYFIDEKLVAGIQLTGSKTSFTVSKVVEPLSLEEFGKTELLYFMRARAEALSSPVGGSELGLMKRQRAGPCPWQCTSSSRPCGAVRCRLGDPRVHL